MKRDERKISSSFSPQDTVEIGCAGKKMPSVSEKTAITGESSGSRKEAFYQEVIRNDELPLQDGFDSCRDITGVWAKEGRPEEPYRFRVDLANLKPGAELGNLDSYLLISLGRQGEINLPDGLPGITDHPWNISVGAYDRKNFTVLDDTGKKHNEALRDLKFDLLRKSVEFSLDKSVLREKNWKDGDPLYLQPFTCKDFLKRITDTIGDPANKPWLSQGNLIGAVRTDSPVLPPNVREPDWRDEIIYFILTDRFFNADVTNDYNVVPGNLKKYHGGDLQGIIDKLEYIKSLGATAIWISPTMDNQQTFLDSDGYHGYWPVNFYKMEEHQGDLEKLKELVARAHESGIKVILDLPLNQVAWEHPWLLDPAKRDWFHHIGDIKDWNDEEQVEKGSMFGLPDLAQENPVVEKYLIDMTKWWISQTGIDGLRLDAVRHIPHWFWQKFSREIHGFAGPDFLLVGEDMHGDPAHVARYQKDGIESLFDMPLYFTIRDVLAREGSMEQLADRLAEEQAKIDNPQMFSALLDNHDLSRFMTIAGEKAREKLKLALAFILTLDRIPTIYYGTEVGMEGSGEFGQPPENRKDMEWNRDPELLSYFKKLTHLRNWNIALRRGTYLEMWKDRDILAYERWHPDQEAIVVLNNSRSPQSREIPIRAESSLKDGTRLRNLLGDEVITVQGGRIRVTLEGKEPMILVPEG